MSLPPQDKPSPSPNPWPDSPSPAGGEPGRSSSPPPPGSHGYRAQGEPLPRGVLWTGAHRQTDKPVEGTAHPTPPRPTPQPFPASSPVTDSGVLDFSKVPPPDAPPPPSRPTPPPSDLPPVDGPPPAGAGTPTNYSGLVFILALLVSLAAHGTLAWKLYDRPLGHIDPSLINQERELQRPYRVYRSPGDVILTSHAPGVASRHNPGLGKPQSPLTDLSIAMLAAPSQAQPDLTPPMDVQPARRPFADRRPDPTPASPANPPAADVTQPPGKVGTPDITLPIAIEQQLLVDIPLSTQYTGTGGSSHQGQGVGAIPGLPLGDDQGAGSSEGQSQATSLLADSQDTAVPLNPLPPAMPAPKLTDRAAIPEGRPLALDLMPGPIDLSSVTASAATQLSIPEHLDNDFDYVLSRHVPKGGWGVSHEEERGYFRVDITAKRSLKKLQTMPKDLVILIDTSGSVPQDWINSTLRGVRDSLASLNPGDRFNIVLFKDNPAILGPDGILPVTDENLAKAQAFLTSAQSGGLTDVNQALSRLLVRDVAIERAYELVLISDGRPTQGVMNTRELINLITRDNDLAASIYCVGIGRAQNRTLLEFLAYRNKGFCVFAANPFEAAATIRDLMSRLRYPIMKDIRLSVLGLNIEEVFPSDLPTIHQGETFSIFGRYDDPGKPFTMRLIGHNGKQMFDFTFTRDLSQAPMGDDQISHDWGFWKLHHLYNQMIRQGDTREVRQAIEYLRRKYKLQTLYQN